MSVVRENSFGEGRVGEVAGGVVDGGWFGDVALGSIGNGGGGEDGDSRVGGALSVVVNNDDHEMGGVVGGERVDGGEGEGMEGGGGGVGGVHTPSNIIISFHNVHGGIPYKISSIVTFMRTHSIPIYFVQESFTTKALDHYINTFIPHSCPIVFTTLLDGTISADGSIRKGLGVFLDTNHTFSPTITSLLSDTRYNNIYFASVNLRLVCHGGTHNISIINVYSPQYSMNPVEYVGMLKLLHSAVAALSLRPHALVLVGGDFNMRSYMNGDNTTSPSFSVFSGLSFPLIITNNSIPSPICPNFTRAQGNSHSTLD